MSLNDRTGAPVSVAQESDRFLAVVDGEPAAQAFYLDRAGQRIFHHTESLDGFEGRGIATLLIAEALRRTVADGYRVVPVCPLVAAYLEEHPDLSREVDKPTRETLDWLRSRLSD
jgi:hypothetical protein